MAIFAPSTRKASRIALAAAIMSVGAFSVTAFDAPAFAQKKKDKDKKEAEERQFSDAFSAAFLPVEEASKAGQTADAALLDMILATESTVSTDDDKVLFGDYLYRTARKVSNYELASKGLELMFESGKIPEESRNEYAFIAGQLAYNIQNYPLARQRFEQAQQLGYVNPEMESLIFQTFTRANDNVGALQYAANQLNAQIRAGQTPSKVMIDRGFAIAYNNSMPTDAANFALLAVKHYPSEESWRNAIAIQRNFGEWSDPEVLDLMRLMHATGAMTEEREYADYIYAGNFRRLPAEVGAIAQEGVDKGILNSSEALVREALDGGRERGPELRADLPKLASDAKASGAQGSLAMASGDAYLNFGEAAKAVELYELALTRPDVDRQTALTRLGIAQFKSGDFGGAQETFAMVQGNREPIAKLWAAYVANQASGSATAAAS